MKAAWLGRAAYYVALVVVIAALTHFTALLMIPAVAERDAFARVAALAPPFKTVGLPAASPKSREFPYADPAVASAVCVYDLAAGPVRARMALGRAS